MYHLLPKAINLFQALSHFIAKISQYNTLFISKLRAENKKWENVGTPIF
jgi:hypothetical protein